MAHTHAYIQHPTWPGHVTCSVCGFTIPKAYAPKAGAR